MDANFKKLMEEMGIVRYNEQDNLWKIAKHCAATAGIPLAGAGAVLGSSAGTVAVPVVGTISGAAAGALAGLFAGTVGCTMLNYSVRNEIKKLAEGQ
jgi:uncharacterized membrane protein